MRSLLRLGVLGLAWSCHFAYAPHSADVKPKGSRNHARRSLNGGCAAGCSTGRRLFGAPTACTCPPSPPPPSPPPLAASWTQNSLKCAASAVMTSNGGSSCDGWSGTTVAQCKSYCESNTVARGCTYASNSVCTHIHFYPSSGWCHLANTCTNQGNPGSTEYYALTWS